MPARELYEQNEGQAQVGAATLLNMLSGSKHITSGFGIFALKSLAVSWCSGTVGLRPFYSR